MNSQTVTANAINPIKIPDFRFILSCIVGRPYFDPGHGDWQQILA